MTAGPSELLDVGEPNRRIHLCRERPQPISERVGIAHANGDADATRLAGDEESDL